MRVGELHSQRDPVHLLSGSGAGDVIDDHNLPGVLVRCQPACAMGSQLGQIRRGHAVARNQCHADDLAPVRRWPTARRGRILIHAARVPDERREAWALVPEEVRETAHFRGGLIGAGELTGCLSYRTVEAFTADQARHFNDPAWFEPPILYGFTFTGLVVLPFRRYPGWMRFFPVTDRPRGKIPSLE